VWFYAWFRDRPEEHPAVNAAERELIRAGALPADKSDEPRPPTPWAAIFRSRAMWCINGQQFFKAAGYVFYITWFPEYLQKTRQVTLAEVGFLASLPHVALTIGAIFGGWLSDALLARGGRRLGRQALGAASLVLCGLIVLFAYPIANPLLAVLVISFGGFCSSLSGPCAYAMTIDLGGRHVAPVFSTMNMSGNVGAILFPLAVPYLVDAVGWDAVLLLFAGLHVLAGLCWLPFNPNVPIVERD
jgi:ACS family glucarate transporter-like MFS transporter